MRRRVLLFVTIPSIILLLALTASVSIKNVLGGGFSNPVVTVTPSETDIGQEVLVKAVIAVATG